MTYRYDPGCACCVTPDLFLIGGATATFPNGVSENIGYTVADESIAVMQSMPNVYKEFSKGQISGDGYALRTQVASPGVEACKYNTASNAWSSLADLPSPTRASHAGTESGSKVYLMGGQTDDENDEYDPSTDSYTARSNVPSPTPRTSARAFVLSSNIYLTGGIQGEPSGSHLDDNDEYDPSGDSWTAKTAIWGTVRDHADFAISDEGYITGGRDGSGLYDTTEKYDPVGDSWSSKTVYPDDVSEASGSSFDGNGYVMAGDHSISGGGGDEINEYDPVGDSWATAAPVLSDPKATHEVISRATA